MDQLEAVTGGILRVAEGAEEASSDCTRCVLLEGEQIYCREGDHLFGGLYGSRSCFENVLTLSAPLTSWGSSGNFTMWKSS